MMRRKFLTLAVACLPILAAASGMLVVNQWSQQFPGGAYTWDGATTFAANLVEGGFSDWRLATRAEWQTAITNGTVGSLQPNLGPGNYFWTADHQGTRAWMVEIVTDPNGNVIAAQSGATKRVLKGSATYAVAVR